MPVEFCDTNILIYAYDRSAGPKRVVAQDLLDRLWQSRNGAVSIQGLQELAVWLIRKASEELSYDKMRVIVSDLGVWHVVAPSANDVVVALDHARRWQLSFWDAMIVAAANGARADILWSEDLNDGQNYGGVVVRNPFRIDRAVAH